MMYIAIVNHQRSLSGILCKLFTGLSDTHVFICDDKFLSRWEQDVLFVKRVLPSDPRADFGITIFEAPFDVSREYLDALVLSDVAKFCAERRLSNIYGVRDYVGFMLRRMGYRIRNFGGVVCSGRIRDIGYEHGFSQLGSNLDLEPSPADWRRCLTKIRAKVISQGETK